MPRGGATYSGEQFLGCTRIQMEKGLEDLQTAMPCGSVSQALTPTHTFDAHNCIFQKTSDFQHSISNACQWGFSFKHK